MDTFYRHILHLIRWSVRMIVLIFEWNEFTKALKVKMAPVGDGSIWVTYVALQNTLYSKVNWLIWRFERIKDRFCRHEVSALFNIYIYIYIYIYCLPQTDCFVVSQLFSVARQATFPKLGSKPGWLKRQSLILPLSHEETSESEGNLNTYVSHLFCLHIYA